MQDKKIKVLIVDDEFHIAMLIKKLIQWDSLGMECLNVVSNGEEAYNIVINAIPDIVITDIRMPKINGLDLISMTKNMNDKIKFIVISGYKEFDYAHKALQYGVNDYLLKPVSGEELNKVLEKLQSEISVEGLKKKEAEQSKRTLNASEQIIKTNLLNSIIDQEDHPSLKELEEDYNLKFKGELYLGINIKLDYWDYGITDNQLDAITVDKVIELVENNLIGNVHNFLSSKKSSMHIYYLINYDRSNSKVVKNIISKILSEIHNYLIAIEQYRVTVGIGSETTEFQKVENTIRESYIAVQNRIKLGTGRLIFWDSLTAENSLIIEKFLSPHKEQFLTSVESLSWEALELVVNQIFDELQSVDNIDFSCCYDIAYELVDIYFGHHTVHSVDGNQVKQFLLNASQHCYSLIQLKDLLKDNLSKHLETCYKTLELETAKPIRQAKQYISENYSEKITLEDISTIVDLNPVYFSVLFKKETGMNFIAYLTHTRMEIAKEILRTSNKKISAIGEEVGYKDTRHFSQTFTKTVGIQPALYRKLYS